MGAVGVVSSLAPTPLLRIGILAPEFSTQHGGMQVLARELVARLSALADCRIIARADREIPETDLPVLAVLRNDLSDSRTQLARWAEPDVWLALNAGTSALAPFLRAPLVTYVNGNDLLEPWFGFDGSLVRALDRLPRTDRVTRFLRRRGYRASALAGARASRLLIANSINTKALVERALGPDSPPVHIVEPGVMDSFFRDERDAELRSRAAGSPLRLLTVSRLSSATRRKNVDGMLRAVASLPAGVVARYTITGDGDDRPRLESLASELGISDRVQFTGALHASDVVELYQDTDLFMLASTATSRDVEGFGIVYMEASASGVPSLGSLSGGATDAIIPGENGLLVQDGSPEAIAEGILAVFEQQVRVDPAAARAVAGRYRWSLVADRMLKELQEVVDVRKSPPSPP